MNNDHRKALLTALEILNRMKDRKMIERFLDEYTLQEVCFMQEQKIDNQMLVAEICRYHPRWFRKRMKPLYRMNQWLGWLAREFL